MSVANDLKISNTFWYQQVDDRYTFEAQERNAKSILNYFVLPAELNNIGNIRTEFAEVGTQHKLDLAEMTIRKRAYKANKTCTLHKDKY